MAATRFFTLKSQVPLPAGGSLGFKTSRGFYARPAASPTGAPGGLQPMTPAQIANTIAGYTNSLPAPQTPGQIQQTAQSEISPIIQNLTDTISRQTRAGEGAISGYSSNLAQQLAAELGNVESTYGDAAQALAASNAAQAEGIKGTGNDLASGLAGKLAQIQAGPAASAVALGPVTEGATGAANAAYGHGSAALDQLLSDAAAQGAYTAKLPGIAREQGLTDINNLNLAGQKTLADQTGAVEQKIPDIVQALTTASNTAETNRASAAMDAYKYLTSRNDALALGTAKNQAAVQVANTKAAEGRYAANQKAATAREAAAAKAAQTSFDNRLKFAKTYGYDPVTGATLPGYTKNAQGQVVKTTTSTKGELTDSQAAKLVQQWHDGKTVSVTTPVVDPKTGKQQVSPTTGKPITTTKTAVQGTLNYGQAYAMLRQFGKTDVQARKLLDTVYAKGDQGRAWVTNEEQIALKKAGVPYKAKTIKDAQGATRGLLGPRQVAALKAAHQLPPGQMTSEGWFVIAPVN